MVDAALTRQQAFEPLLAYAKSRLASVVAARTLPLDDAEFLARAVFELESDGVGLFEPARWADDQFYCDVRSYLAARVGEAPVQTLAVDAGGVRELAASTTPSELERRRPSLDRVLIQLVTHTEVAA